MRECLGEAGVALAQSIPMFRPPMQRVGAECQEPAHRDGGAQHIQQFSRGDTRRKKPSVAIAVPNQYVDRRTAWNDYCSGTYLLHQIRELRLTAASGDPCPQ